jgi:hypothetical protein
MRKAIRPVALAMALVLVAAACSKPKGADDGVSAAGTDAPKVDAPVVAAGSDTTATTAAAAAQPGAQPGTAAAQGAAPGNGSTTMSAGDVAQAKAVGALVKPQSTEKVDSSWSGVSSDSVKLVFSIDAASCGVAVVNAVTAAGGALATPTRFYRAAPTTQDDVNAENREAVDIMVKYWNDHAQETVEFFPEIGKVMEKYNSPGHPFYGRKLDYEVIDGGSNQCPEKTTAAAREAVEKHAFVVYNNLEGASPAGAYNMVAALNTAPADRRPMHFGSLWLSDQDYTRFAPYAWTQFATGSTITRQYASWVCSRVRTGQVPSRSPMVKDPKKRVFGLVHTNLEQDVRLANELKGYLKQFCGADIVAKEVAYEGNDFGKAQQDNANLIVQLKVAGVTSVMMLTDPVQPLFQLNVATQQDYHPEWLWNSFGYEDSSTVQRLYKDTGQTEGSIGTSNLGVPGGFGFGAGDPFRMYHASHQIAPDGKPCDPSSDEGMSHGNADVERFCKSPGVLVTWYYSMLASVGGMLFAGPELNPTNVSVGLQHYPTTRYGGNGPTSDPRPALVGAGDGKYGFVVDAVEWRWRNDFTSPPPESKGPDDGGWVEYPDCQRHFLQWPDVLAPNWETDGPNYNAWCGDPKTGYPRVLPEDSNG